jgi:DnaJ-class molecular chaperone
VCAYSHKTRAREGWMRNKYIVIVHPIALTPESRSAMPKDKKKPCKNCEGRGLLKVGDRKVKCQRCGGTGVRS